ncbi:flippase [Yersinia alsatica]|uniref:flippase n=1 Tax=Yersinia alsatica TaxID=2890317 RepID=UPI0011AA8BF3|nr:flippase [Yersinia alsatica]
MVIKNTFWMVSEKVIRLIVSVFISAIIARYLGPVEFGQLNYYIAILTIATVLSSLGLNRIIVREVVDKIMSRTKRSVIVSTSLYLRLLASLLIWIIISFIFYAISTSQDSLNIAIILSSVVFISIDVLDYHQQGLSSFKIISLCRTVGFIISALIRMVFILLELPLIWFVSAVSIEYAITAIIIYFICNRSNGPYFVSYRNFNMQKTKALLIESWPEIIAGFGAILFMKMDQIMLQLMKGPASVGIYSAATRISEAWYFVPTAIVAATFPKLIELRKVSNISFLNGVSMLSTLLVYMSLLMAIFFTLFGGFIIRVIYGGQYLDSAGVVILHTWGAVFLCMGISSGSWLVAEKKLKLNLYRNLFGLLINFILNIALIPIYGVKGAAIATVAGLASAFYIFDFFIPSLRGMFWLKTKSFLPTQAYKLIVTLLNYNWMQKK